MIHRNLIFPAVFFLGTVCSGGLTGCAKTHHPEGLAPERVSNVSVIEAQKVMVPDWLEAIGTVQAGQTSQVASQMMGNILELRVREGDRVERGEVLAVIDDAQPRAAVEQSAASVTQAEKEVSAADADFALADATWKRYEQLYEKKSASPQEFDEIKARRQAAEARRGITRARLSQAQAALNQAQTMRSYAQIRAPFGGVVTERKADAGALALPGAPIFTVEDTRNFRLEATVDESSVRLVHIGQFVPVVIDGLDGPERSGRVTHLVPAADPATRSFLVKIELPFDPRLHSGLFGRAHFPHSSHAAILIPQAAVVARGQLQGVYVVGANRIAGLRYVTLGRSADERVEVLAGLQEGEKLVAAPGGQGLSGKEIITGQ